MNKYGMNNYQAIRNAFEQAVINTAGEIIKTTSRKQRIL